MFGEVKLDEADYTIIWETLLFCVKYLMSNILERAFWSLQPFQGFLQLENGKNIRHKFSTFASNLVTLAWKMNPGMPKLITLFNGPLCAYLMRQNLHNQTRPRS